MVTSKYESIPALLRIMLSRRSEVYLGEPEFLVKCLVQCGRDAYNSKENREGFVNLGTAVNSLCEEVIKKRLEQVYIK